MARGGIAIGIPPSAVLHEEEVTWPGEEGRLQCDSPPL